MKISFITTVDHNIGDDFVREGLKYLLGEYFSDTNLEFQNIHKHAPVTTRFGYEKIRNLRLSRAIDFVVPIRFSRDRVKESDFVIQSGAPVYWCHSVDGGHCYKNEWYVPLIKDRFLKNNNAKLLNLAAGTCQKYESSGNEFCESCLDYIREFYNLASVTTVRDKLSKIVLAKNNIDVPVIPCSSIFAIDNYGLRNLGGEYIVLNYMKGGAHYSLGQDIDVEKWEREFKKFYFDLKKKEKVILVCHNQSEVDQAYELDKDAEIFFKENNYLAYMDFYANAKFGILNRVHGAFLLASYGKPSIVIGNDSRAKMVAELGLRSYFVNDVDFDLLSEQYECLKNETNDYPHEFIKIKDRARTDYMEAFSVL